MHPLIPDSARKLLEEQDERRYKARLTASPKRFRDNFIATHADQIEMLRRGAIVEDVDRYGNILSVTMPDGKPVPSLRSARYTILWSRIAREFRWLKPLIGILIQNVNSGVRSVLRIVGTFLMVKR